MDRRRFLLTSLAGAFAAPLAAEAQRPSQVRQIGYLQAHVSGLPGAFYEVLREGLRDLGYVVDRNLVLEYRIGESRARLDGGRRLPPPREPRTLFRSCSRTAVIRSRPVSSRVSGAPAGI